MIRLKQQQKARACFPHRVVYDVIKCYQPVNPGLLDYVASMGLIDDSLALSLLVGACGGCYRLWRASPSQLWQQGNIQREKWGVVHAILDNTSGK